MSPAKYEKEPRSKRNMKPQVDYIMKYGRPGDIIGCSGKYLGSDFINVVTYGIPRWSLSHVGILADVDGKLLIFQSTTQCCLPCHFQKKLVSGTQAQEIGEFVATDRSRIYHYPLSRELYAHEKVRLRRSLIDDLGIKYDMLGAFRAGGRLWAGVGAHLHKQSKASIFCSEWCASQHSNIGIMPTANFSRWNPNSFVRRERRFGILLPPIRVA